MKAVTEYNDTELRQAQETYNNLRQKTNDTEKPLLEFTKRSGYAHYKFEGVYRAELITALGRTPTPEELIMLIDNGFSHFGASCSIDHATRKFWGHVNID